MKYAVGAAIAAEARAVNNYNFGAHFEQFHRPFLCRFCGFQTIKMLQNAANASGNSTFLFRRHFCFAQDPRWGRSQEVVGEDPLAVGS